MRTDVNAVPAALAARFTDNAALKPLLISSGIYNLMWDLAKSDIPARLNPRIAQRRTCCTAA